MSVSEAEKQLVKKELNSKIALSAKECSSLQSSQLVQFPAKDFWDHKKSNWRATKLGAWAKQNSRKVKAPIGEEKFTSV